MSILNLKSEYRFTTVAVFLSLTSIISFLFGACSKQPSEKAAQPEQLNLIPYRKGEKWGFSDEKKNIVIQPKYDDAEPFSDGLARVQLAGRAESDFINAFGYIDNKGNEVIPVKYIPSGNDPESISAKFFQPFYERYQSFSEGLLSVCSVGANGKCGYMDRNGNLVIPFTGSPFSEGLAAVRENSPKLFKWGYIDKSGNEVIPFKYDKAYPFSEGLAAVMLNKKWGFLDKSGKEITPLKWDDVKSFSEGLAVVKLNNKYGYIDTNGKEVIPLRYDFANSFSEDLAAVGKTVTNSTSVSYYVSYIDKNGKEVIPFGKYRFDKLSFFSEGLAVAINENTGKEGYIDKSGNEVIPSKYQLAHPFYEGLAVACLDYKCGYIDKSSNEIIPLKYAKAYPFSKGLALVESKSGMGYIGRDGTEYFEP